MSAIFDPDNGRAQIFSHGGGTQGSAICALIVQGRLPKPQACVISDTGREATQVWRYWDAYTRPALEAIGVPCHRLPHAFSSGDDGYNTVDLFTGKDGKTIAMPMYTGGGGMLAKYCSNEWKRRPIERFMRRDLGLSAADVWIGFSTDEATTRARFSPQARWRDVYPLIELGICRADCIQICLGMGWPPPPRSACWMCPYRDKTEWLDLRDNWPGDWQAAIKLGRELRRHDPDVYFHRSGTPLDEVDWDGEPERRYEPGCQSGMCFT